MAETGSVIRPNRIVFVAFAFCDELDHWDYEIVVGQGAVRSFPGVVAPPVREPITRESWYRLCELHPDAVGAALGGFSTFSKRWKT
jgi:hypothetical protein